MRLKKIVRRAFAAMGFRLVKLDADARRYSLSSYNREQPLPPGAEAFLRTDNPQLVEISRAYAAFSGDATVHSQWNATQLRRNLALAYFRGDNVYVWQYRQVKGDLRVRQYLAMLDIRARDRLGLLRRLGEDGLFGCWTFRYAQSPDISRDLLDSVNEINYLNDMLQLEQRTRFSVLDIGAGYGRLAHRFSQAFGERISAYHCIDAIAQSTFLCDYYLRFRGVPADVRAIRLDQYQEQLAGHYDLAVNVHSFSECTQAAVRWWLARLAERSVEWLLIVPNDPEQLLTTETDRSKRDFLPDVLAAGDRMVDKRPVHQDDALRELIGVRDHFFLFQRT
jgi:putative sugar O-methyltransferase